MSKIAIITDTDSSLSIMQAIFCKMDQVIPRFC